MKQTFGNEISFITKHSNRYQTGKKMTKQKMISRTYDLIRSHEENAKRAEKKYLRPDTDDGTNYGVEAIVEWRIAMALRSLYLEF